MNWQTPVALAIVAITLTVFVIRLLKRRNLSGRRGCGENCGCSVKPTVSTKSPTPPES